MPKRSDTPQTDIGTPLPADRPGLEDSLTALLAERASLQDVLAAHPDRERRLFSRNAPEAEVQANDVTRRRLMFQLNHLDGRERDIRVALAQADVDLRRSSWHEFVDEFDTLSERFVAGSQNLRAAHEALIDLHHRAALAGFSEYSHPTARIPMPQFRIDYSAIAAFRDYIHSLRRVDPQTPQKQKLYLIRFLEYAIVLNGRFLTAYQAKSVAGFDARIAWQIVENGKAEWIDEIPPRTAGLAKRKYAEVQP